MGWGAAGDPPAVEMAWGVPGASYATPVWAVMGPRGSTGPGEMGAPHSGALVLCTPHSPLHPAPPHSAPQSPSTLLP